MPFFPTLYKDIGKKAADLLTKKYDFSNEVSVCNKSEGGVKVESGASFDDKTDTYVKLCYKCKDFGEAEAEIHTAASDKDTKAKVKFDAFSKGSAITLSVSSVPNLDVEASYKQDSINSQLKFSSDGTAMGLGCNLAVGTDGYSLGVSSSIDLAAQQLKGLDVGAEGTIADIVAAIKTEKNRSLVSLSAFHKLSGDCSLGTKVAVNLKDMSKSLTFGTEYDLSKATSAKARLEHTGAIALALEHSLSNPDLKVGVSAQFDVLNIGAPAESFGMSFSFGD